MELTCLINVTRDKGTYQFSKKGFLSDCGAELPEMWHADLPHVEYLVLAQGNVSAQKDLFCQLFANERCHLAHELWIHIIYDISLTNPNGTFDSGAETRQQKCDQRRKFEKVPQYIHARW